MTITEDTASSNGRNDTEKDSSNGQAEATGSGSGAAASSVLPEDDSASTAPRKHKKLHRAAPAEPPPVENSVVPIAPLQTFRKPTNPYSIYMSIKAKVSLDELFGRATSGVDYKRLDNYGV